MKKQPFPPTVARAVASLFFALSAALLTAADWPQYRGGPELRGVAAGKLADRLDLLWSFKTGGPVKSSAAIVGGNVFVGSDDGFLYSLALATGKTNWAFKTGGNVESSPLVHEGHVFFGSDEPMFYALDAKSGKQVWKFPVGDKMPGAPNLVRAPNGKDWNVVFGNHDAKLYCLDAATGKSNWVYETGNGINGTPAVFAGQTALGGCDALLHIVALTNGSKVKELEVGAPVLGSVAVADWRVYGGHFENQVFCVDVAKGTNLWSYRDRAFAYVSSPAVLGDRLVIGGRDKRVHCLRTKDGEAIWTFGTRGKVDSSPVICDGKVVVGSEDGRLYLLALADGKELWSYEIGQGLAASPAVSDGKVVIGSEDGSVYCFGVKGK
jgi:eukaryotic-like serine/threonine-protein kinase